MAKPTNFFVLVDDTANPVRRLPLTQDLQVELSKLFSVQAKDLSAPHLERIAFDGRLAADDSQVLYIDDFALPEAIWGALEAPTTVDPFSFDSTVPERVKAVFTGNAVGKPWVTLQCFERRQLLARKGVSIIASGSTFKRLEAPGLTIGDSVTSHYVDAKLLFRSYHFAKRIFDLSAYYRAATDAEIRSVFSGGLAKSENEEQFVAEADSWIRRKIALILASGTLARPHKDIVDRAKEFDLEIAITKNGSQEVIMLPADKRRLKQLLRFLDEDYYFAPITGAKYVSNSKHRLTS